MTVVRLSRLIVSIVLLVVLFLFHQIYNITHCRTYPLVAGIQSSLSDQVNELLYSNRYFSSISIAQPQYYIPSFAQAIRTIWASQVVPVDFPIFYTPDEKTWSLAEPPIWESGFGKRLCIVDIDTRPADRSHQAWSPEKFDYQSLDDVSAGRLNHYLYAVIHGYDYRYIHTQKQEDKNDAWTRISALHALLSSNTYEFVVYADADVIFPHLHLPFEWLMNRWNITRDISITMALDVDWDVLKDSRGRQTVNAGFQTLSNTNITLEILEQWDRCLDGLRYPDCGRFRQNWPAEQGAFSEFLRYDYHEVVKELPCNEALLWPGSGEGCEGVFVRHYTMEKEKPKQVLGVTVAESVLRGVRENMMRQKARLYIEGS